MKRNPQFSRIVTQVVAGRITVAADPEDMTQLVRGVGAKVATGQRLSDTERDALLAAIAQKLGIL